MDARLFHKRLGDAAEQLIPPRGGVVCAVSGGADSTALLEGMVRVNEIRRRRWQLAVAHLDHGLRAESAEEARFVEARATALGLSFHTRRIDAKAAARRRRVGVEEAAREERYAFLREVAESAGAGIVAVAHHADDQAETILHHIIRGTGLRGLAGMPASRPIARGSTVLLVRPLLEFTRKELVEYLAARRIPCREDASNADPDAARRNRIRVEVLPLLQRALNPAVVTALLRLSEQARRAADVLTGMAGETMRHLRVEETAGGMVLPAPELASAPAAIQGEVIHLVLERLGATGSELGFERLEAVRSLLSGTGRKRTIELAGGVTAMRRGRRLIFQCRGGRATMAACSRLPAAQGRTE